MLLLEGPLFAFWRRADVCFNLLYLHCPGVSACCLAHVHVCGEWDPY